MQPQVHRDLAVQTLALSTVVLRLELRALDPSHYDLIQALEEQEDVWESIGALPLPGEQGAHLFAIVEGVGAIGVGGLVPSSVLGTQDFEVVCALLAEAQMRGFATQACQLIVSWAFNTARLERVIACIDETNEGAKSVAAKLGMKALRRLGPGRTVFVRYRVDETGP